MNEIEVASKFVAQLVKDLGLFTTIIIVLFTFLVFNGKWIIDKISSSIKERKSKKLLQEEVNAKNKLIEQNQEFIASISNITELFNEFITNYDVIISYSNFNTLKDYLVGYRPNFIVEVNNKLHKYFEEKKFDVFALNYSIKQLYIDIIHTNLNKFIYESFLDGIKEECLKEIEKFLEIITEDNYKEQFNELLKVIDKILVDSYNDKVISDFGNGHIRKVR